MESNKVTWKDVEQYLNSTRMPVAILPVGCVEAHGPHLPLTTDSVIAEEIAKAVGYKINGLVLPVLNYGQTWSLRDFPGTISISTETLKNIIKEVAVSLQRCRIEFLVIINGHVGNDVAIREAAKEIINKGIKILYFNPAFIRESAKEYLVSSFWHSTYFHAEELETSLMLYLRPECVKMDKAVAEYPEKPYDLNFTPYPWVKLTKSGVLGDPTKASRDKGAIIFNKVVNEIVNVVLRTVNRVV